MITICNIRQANYRNYDEVWAIVRSLKKPDPHWRHVPELSPDWSLFKTMLYLNNNGSWNEDSFKRIYTPQFLKQMKSASAMKKLTELRNLDLEGKNICLFCYCPNKNTCHRKLIYGLLKSMGCNCRII